MQKRVSRISSLQQIVSSSDQKWQSIEAKTVYKDSYMVEFELNTLKGEQYFSISFAFDPSCRLAVKSGKKLPGN